MSDENKKIVLVMLGAPGAGKGTYCAKLIERYGTPQISTGDMFRAAIKDSSDLGKTVEADLAAGVLVPDEIVNRVVQERITKPDCEKGFILDGYPRAVSQAGNLDRLLFQEGLRITAVVHLDVPEDVIFKRLTGRRLCKSCPKGNFNVYTLPPKVEGKCDHCGGELWQRPDDTENVIRKRLDTYKQQTQPLIEFYEARGQLRTIPYEGTIDEMVQKVFDAVDREEIGKV